MGKRQSLTEINRELTEEIQNLGKDIDYLCQQVADYEFVLRYYQYQLKTGARAAETVLRQYGAEHQILH